MENVTVSLSPEDWAFVVSGLRDVRELVAQQDIAEADRSAIIQDNTRLANEIEDQFLRGMAA